MAYDNQHIAKNLLSDNDKTTIGKPVVLKSSYPIKKNWFFLLILLIEGASLMAVELMGAKLLAPFYGSSLYVWTAVLGITGLGWVLVANVFKNSASAVTNNMVLFINQYDQSA